MTQEIDMAGLEELLNTPDTKTTLLLVLLQGQKEQVGVVREILEVQRLILKEVSLLRRDSTPGLPAHGEGHPQ